MAMKTNSRIPGIQALLAVALLSSFLVATSGAQTNLSVFKGTFTLTDQVEWGKTILSPGSYTVTIRDSGAPTVALVKDSKGRSLGLFVSSIAEARMTGAGNALLLHQKGGHLCVYSLTLGSLGNALVYDPSLARGSAMEARAIQTVPVMVARR
jgi:hypothetical protein